MNEQIGLFGTDEETYYRNSRGELFCVQSPDLAPSGAPRRVEILPFSAQPLSDEACADLELSDDII